MESFKFENVTINLEVDQKLAWTEPNSDLPNITIDGVDEEFIPIQTHFHHFASEHTIDGKIYPLETHLVRVCV